MFSLTLTVLTISLYFLTRSLFFYGRKHPLLHPIFVSAVVIIFLLEIVHGTAADYARTSNWLTWPLGPATIALAIPLYKQLSRLRTFLLPFVISVSTGSLTTIVAIIGIGRLGGLEADLLNALALKSVTAAIAVSLAQMRKADPSLVTTFVVLTGMIGAMLGPSVLSWFRVTSPLARGVALGTISHAQGTSAALQESEEAAAMASLAMMAVPLLVTIIGPSYIPLLLHFFGY